MVNDNTGSTDSNTVCQKSRYFTNFTILSITRTLSPLLGS